MNNTVLTISIVTYNNDTTELTQTINSVLNSVNVDIHLYIVDNSPTDALRVLFTDKRITYMFNNANVGFGAGHNIAIQKTLTQSKYHLVLNPDIYFDSDVLSKIVQYMNTNNIGLLMPKVTNPNGSVRRIRKLLPTPMNIFGKPITKLPIFNKLDKDFRTSFISYNETCSAPYLSGCFMFFRTSELAKVGGFDERYFMYFEDTDLSRRFFTQSSAIYWPEVSIVHLAHRETYKSFKLFRITVKSAISYFNKWGWFFDKERREANRKVLNRI